MNEFGGERAIVLTGRPENIVTYVWGVQVLPRLFDKGCSNLGAFVVKIFMNWFEILPENIYVFFKMKMDK